MDFEERERMRRYQAVKVIFAEVAMFFTVVIIVVIAILAAMGFFVSDEGSIEQSGLAQIHSMPTGAVVELDGATLFSRTNLSRTMPAGEHNLKITRDGYDSWSKQIKMYSGMLIRLYYPRLFLENRTAEEVMELKPNPMFYSISDDATTVLYADAKSVEWTMLNIRNDEVKATKLDMSKILPDVQAGQQFNGKVEILAWSKDSDYVLTRVTSDAKVEWILVSLKDVSRSLNLTKTFGLNFTQVQMVDGSAAQLFALENHHLRRINTGEQAISRVLLDKVLEFDSEGSDLIYIAEAENEQKEKQKVVGVYRDGEKAGTVIGNYSADTNLKVALAEYYSQDYLIFVVNDKITIYYGAVPSYREDVANVDNADFLGLKILVQNEALSYVPDTINVSREDEYVVLRKGRNFMVVDLEMGDLYEYEAPVEQLRWLDNSMMYMADEGGLNVWDFDYTNQRTLVKYMAEEVDNETQDLAAVTTKSKYPIANYSVAISDNNKWLYYMVKAKDKLVLVREKIRD